MSKIQTSLPTRIQKFIRENVKPLLASALTFAIVIGGLLAYQSSANNLKISNAAGCTNGAIASSSPACNICNSDSIYNTADKVCDPKPPGCGNGATNPPTCDVCPSEMVMLSGDCVPLCTNGAVNKPTCTNCPAGKSFDGTTCAVCPAGSFCAGGFNSDGTPLKPEQCPINTYCPSGATAPNACPTGKVSPVGSTSLSACVDPSCTNGATNPPACTVCSSDKVLSSGQCVVCANGGCANNVCTNGATNTPTCDVCPSGKLFVNGACGQKAITAEELANAISCTPKVVNASQTVTCIGKSPISPEVAVTGLKVKIGDNGVEVPCRLDTNRLIQCDPINVGTTVGTYDIKAKSDQTNTTNPNGVKVDAVTINNPMGIDDLKTSNTVISCNSGDSVKLNSTTSCTFTLPNGKTLPDGFKLSVGDGNPDGSSCVAGANNLITCTNVATGSQTGMQPIKNKVGTATAETGSKANVTADGNGNTLADVINCTPKSAPINTSVKCSGTIPTNTVFTNVKIKVGPGGTEVVCVISGSTITCPDANVGSAGGNLDVLGKSDQITTYTKVDAINVLDYIKAEDMSKINISCNNNKVVLFNSSTTCTFTLPDGKTLPDGFAMGIGDSDPTKSKCVIGNANVVTCSVVPSGSQIGSQPIKVSFSGGTPTDTTQKVTIVKPALPEDIDNAINCTPAAVRPGENVKCSGNLPANVVAEDVKIKLGDTEVVCTVSSPNSSGIRTIDCPTIKAPTTNGVYNVTATMKDLTSSDPNAKTTPKTVSTINVQDQGSTITSDDIKNNNLNISCNTGKDVPVNSVTDCSFTLLPNKFLPADFKLSIGDGNSGQSGQICVVANDKISVVCSNVPTGSKTGMQTVFATLLDASKKSTKIDTGKQVNIVNSINTNPSQITTICPDGQYSLRESASSSAVCTACPKGSYCPKGSITPVLCPTGFTTSGQGANSIDDCNVTNSCLAGQYSQKDLTNGTASCKVCPAGSYCGGGTDQLKSCPKGYYCPDGATNPVACPVGFTTTSEGSKSASDCNVALLTTVPVSTTTTTTNTVRTGGSSTFISTVVTILGLVLAVVAFRETKKRTLQMK